MRLATALVRQAARHPRPARRLTAAARWRPRPTQLRRNAWRCLSSKNDNDDDDGGPVAVTIDDDDSDAPASVGVGDGAPTPDRVLALALARRPLFPGMVHSLSLGPTAAAALQAERDAGRPYVALFLRKEPAEEHEAAELFTPSDLDECLDVVHGTGAFAQVHNVAEGSDGQSQALLLVHRRVDASTVVDAGPPPRLGVEHWPREAWVDEDDSSIPPTKTGRRKKDASPGDLVKALSNEIVAAIRELVQLNPLYREHMQYFTQRVDIADPFKLADFAASLATAKGPDLQVALEERDVVKRLRLALDLVSQERELSKLQQEISQQVETKLSSQQRTFLLNEQLKTIKKELGVETDDKDALVKKFRNRIASIEGIESASEEESAEEKWKDGVIPAVARAAIEEELSKLEALEKNSAEFNVTRNYLDWLTGLPWGSVSGEVFDVAAAKEALDDVHYGMDDVRLQRPVVLPYRVDGVKASPHAYATDASLSRRRRRARHRCDSCQMRADAIDATPSTRLRRETVSDAGQGAHPGTRSGRELGRRRARQDLVSRGPAGHGQDVDRLFHSPSFRERVLPLFCGWPRRRGGDQGP